MVSLCNLPTMMQWGREGPHLTLYGTREKKTRKDWDSSDDPPTPSSHIKKKEKGKNLTLGHTSLIPAPLFLKRRKCSSAYREKRKWSSKAQKNVKTSFEWQTTAAAAAAATAKKWDPPSSHRKEWLGKNFPSRIMCQGGGRKRKNGPFFVQRGYPSRDKRFFFIILWPIPRVKLDFTH